jgi:hypothetical protein
MSEEKIVKTGTFIYGDTATGTIQIIQTSWRPGSGDHEDPEEWREDQFGTFFEVRYSLPTGKMESKAGGGYHDTLQEAIKNIEESCERVEWDK